MQLSIEYKFYLNQNILPGMVSVGTSNSVSTFLIAALSGGKVLVTNLWSAAGNISQTDICSNILNINQSILSIKTGRFNKLSPDKDLIFVGTGASLLVYDIENNSDIFYKEINDGVTSCEIGKLGEHDDNVVVVGGNCSLAAFDHTGQEVLWSVTGDAVSSLAIIDIQNRGFKDLIVGSEDFEIRVFHRDEIINEITETDAVINLCPLGGSMFGYGLSNGTVGVYDRYNRLWRIKSKSIPTVIIGFDINSDGVTELITGWSNGKIDVRNIDNGEVMFKDNMKASIAGINIINHPQYPGELLLVCSVEGEVRIYKKISGGTGISADSVNNQDMIYDLTLRRQNLLMELNSFEEISRLSQNPDEGYVQSIPTDTTVNVTMLLNGSLNKGVNLLFQTNNDVLIRCVMIFAEGIFNGECHVVHPPINKLSSQLNVIITSSKDIAVDLHMKVIVGYKTGSQFHVFEMIRYLPRFSMFQYLTPDKPFTKPSGFVQFSVQERLHRFILWANQNFLFESELELASKDQTELNLRFISIRGNNELELNINCKTNTVTIATDSIELGGNIVQTLVEYLNLDELISVCNFPKEFQNLNEIISKIDGIQTSRRRMTSDIADNSNVIKNFIVRAEDCRIMNYMVGVNECFTELLHLNRDLINRYRIRSNNYQELLNHLKFINLFIQQGGNLRAGKYRTQLVSQCRQAVKNNDLSQLEKLIKTGGAD